MPLRRRAPLQGRRLLIVGALAGFAVFFILVVDGAEVVRSALSGVVMAIWVIAMIAALNWFNRFRAEAIAHAINEAEAEARAAGDGDAPMPSPLDNREIHGHDRGIDGQKSEAADISEDTRTDQFGPTLPQQSTRAGRTQD